MGWRGRRPALIDGVNMNVRVLPPAQDDGPEDDRVALSKEAFKHAFLDNLFYVQGKIPALATKRDYYMALAFTVRDRMLHRWLSTAEQYTTHGSRTVAYLSAEFLMGPHLGNNLLNLGIYDEVREAVGELGLDFPELLACEDEPGLGNGGLGRLAACFLDSMATLEIPSIGYGIRYEFGIFQQEIVDGWQVERTDKWLRFGNAWEIPRPEWAVEVKLGGSTETYTDHEGRLRVRWVPNRVVVGVPYDTPILGYRVNTANTLRLWRAEALESFDFSAFNSGDYSGAVSQKVVSETLSKVLYPNDEALAGKELRLEQQYFFVCCSLQDMMRILRVQQISVLRFHEKFAAQLNDTHPSIAVAELMRLLVDEYAVDWDTAWSITRKTFGYTNHTLLPEALEHWPIAVFGKVLPRHLDIVYEINARFLEEVRIRFLGDEARIVRMSLIDENGGRYVRMANLACCRQSRGERCGRPAFAASEAEPDEGLLRPLAGEVQQQDQRRDPAPLARSHQSAARGTHQRGHRRWLGQGPRQARGVGKVRRRRAVPEELARHQAGQQRRPRRAGARPYRRQCRPGVAVRRAGEAHPRIQAPTPERPAHHLALSPYQVGSALRDAAAHVHLRRQGGARLLHREAHHQTHHRGRRCRESRPAGARPAEGRLHAELQRHQRAADLSGRGPVGTDLHRRQGGFRYRQHEVLYERRAHHRHAGRCQHRDPPRGRPREFLHVRAQRRGSGGITPRRLSAGRLLRE